MVEVRLVKSLISNHLKQSFKWLAKSCHRQLLRQLKSDKLPRNRLKFKACNALIAYSQNIIRYDARQVLPRTSRPEIFQEDSRLWNPGLLTKSWRVHGDICCIAGNTDGIIPSWYDSYHSRFSDILLWFANKNSLLRITLEVLIVLSKRRRF